MKQINRFQHFLLRITTPFETFLVDSTHKIKNLLIPIDSDYEKISNIIFYLPYLEKDLFFKIQSPIKRSKNLPFEIE